jgi:hypothetical protein
MDGLSSPFGLDWAGRAGVTNVAGVPRQAGANAVKGVVRRMFGSRAGVAGRGLSGAAA